MAQMRINRSFRACTTVVLVFSLVFFWLPTLLWIDLTHAIAGFLAGIVASSPAKGAITGATGGIIVAVLHLLVAVLLGLLDAGALVGIALIPCYTAAFGWIGGVSARTT